MRTCRSGGSVGPPIVIRRAPRWRPIGLQKMSQGLRTGGGVERWAKVSFGGHNKL